MRRHGTGHQQRHSGERRDAERGGRETEQQARGGRQFQTADHLPEPGRHTQAVPQVEGVYRVFEQAAAADPALAAPWREYQRRRLQDVVWVVDAVRAVTPLRPGLTPERAAETLWAMLTWHPVALLVEERGWTEADVAEWLRDVLTAVLLPPAGEA
jgi:hypothetical protein